MNLPLYIISELILYLLYTINEWSVDIYGRNKTHKAHFRDMGLVIKSIVKFQTIKIETNNELKYLLNNQPNIRRNTEWLLP